MARSTLSLEQSGDVFDILVVHLDADPAARADFINTFASGERATQFVAFRSSRMRRVLTFSAFRTQEARVAEPPGRHIMKERESIRRANELIHRYLGGYEPVAIAPFLRERPSALAEEAS